VIFNSPVAQVRRTSDPNVAEFYIKPSAHNLFQLSPNQFSRSIPQKVFDSTLFEALFGKGTVPAHLTWQGKNGEEGVLVNLTVKSLNKKQGTLKFNATLNPLVPSVLADKSRFVGKPVEYGKLKNAALFVVAQNARVIRHTNKEKSSNIVSNFLRPMTETTSVCVIQPFTVCEAANLTGADLYDADLSGADLTSAVLSYADLSYAEMSFSNLTGAYMISANLYGADLQPAEMSNSTLRYADLELANLSGADLTSADLTSAVLSRANLSYSDIVFSNLTGADLSYADLSYAGIVFSNLTGANLTGANLTFARQRDPNLTGATGCSTTTPPLSGC
jgi:uncharacterized protein YjbI with pentapeptide repeats